MAVKGAWAWVWGALLVVPGSAEGAWGCQKDADCARGGSCFIARGLDQGVCMGLEVLGKSESDAKQLQVPLRNRYGAGYPCQFHVDCLPNYACYKRRGAPQGVCSR